MNSPCCIAAALAALMTCCVLLVRPQGTGTRRPARKNGRPRSADAARKLLARLRRDEARQRPQEGRN